MILFRVVAWVVVELIMAWKTIVMRPGILTTPGNSQMETLNWAQPKGKFTYCRAPGWVEVHENRLSSWIRNSLWDDQNPPRGALGLRPPRRLHFNTSISPRDCDGFHLGSRDNLKSETPWLMRHLQHFVWHGRGHQDHLKTLALF